MSAYEPPRGDEPPKGGGGLGFRIRESAIGAMITCAKCGRVVGHFTPFEIIEHAATARQYRCEVCDAETPP